MIVKKINLWALLFIGSTVCFAQTTNLGVLNVANNTVFSSVAAFDNQTAARYTNNGEAYFYSDFNNDGTMDYDSVNGARYTRFETLSESDSSSQIISGSEPIRFYDVLFNNNSNTLPAYELQNQVIIRGEADFNFGVLHNDTEDGFLIFEDGAGAVNASDQSTVDGWVQKRGNDSFTFPVGVISSEQAFNRPLTITPSNSSTANDFTVEYFLQNPEGTTIEGQTPTSNRAGSIVFLNNKEFWTIKREQGSGAVALNLSYSLDTTPVEITTAPASELKVARWNNTTGIWEDLGGDVDEANESISIDYNVGEFEIFTLATGMQTFQISNGISSNGDGKNDFFSISALPEPNNLKIFNRWGVKIYETDNYNSNGNVFTGFSSASSTIQSDKKLPTGTYFYVLTFTSSGQTTVKTGYLYITTD